MLEDPGENGTELSVALFEYPVLEPLLCDGGSIWATCLAFPDVAFGFTLLLWSIFLFQSPSCRKGQRFMSSVIRRLWFGWIVICLAVGGAERLGEELKGWGGSGGQRGPQRATARFCGGLSKENDQRTLF